MRRKALFPRQSDNCIACPNVPSCNCAEIEGCIVTNRNCTTCPFVTCVSISQPAPLPTESDCIKCPAEPSCNCAVDEQCFMIQRTCNSCATIQCVSTEQVLPASGKSYHRVQLSESSWGLG
ncbi:hypothetical protein C8R44DRAFT_812252 [Mycena epipterygia]|nr:hypothetical protein C8R44DRAFT_812252 [Mycena epipterygia]